MDARQLGNSIATRCGSRFQLERGRRVVGKFTLAHGQEIGFWSPEASRSSEGNFRIDVTRSQKSALGRFRQSIVGFRLEGEPVSFFLFEQLKSRLTESCVLFNEHEKGHWKLRVSSGNRSLAVRIQGGNEVTTSVEADACRFVQQGPRH